MPGSREEDDPRRLFWSDEKELDMEDPSVDQGQRKFQCLKTQVKWLNGVMKLVGPSVWSDQYS